MATQIALLRGINVGRAKRIAMADLREVVTELGYTNVRTLLNSGNVVFDSKSRFTAPRVAALREAIAARTGVTAEVMVISADELAIIVAENTLDPIVTDPSRCLVAFPAASAHLAKAAVLLDEDWAPEQLAIGSRAAYFWCANGVLDSKLLKEFGRVVETTVTMRNWATVLKLHTLSRPANRGHLEPGHRKH